MKIAKEIEDEVTSAAEDAPFCFVLEWDDEGALSELGSLGSRQARRAAIHQAMTKTKARVLQALRSEPLAEVNDLEGTGQAVVAAPAHLWRTLLSHPDIKAANLRILPNERFKTHG
jgi:hypothetical protein